MLELYSEDTVSKREGFRPMSLLLAENIKQRTYERIEQEKMETRCLAQVVVMELIEEDFNISPMEWATGLAAMFDDIYASGIVDPIAIYHIIARELNGRKQEKKKA